MSIVCIGAACIDHKFHALDAVRDGTSNPARSERRFGGVARNVAENLARLGAPVALCSVVGCDDDGSALLAHLRDAGIDTASVIVASDVATPQYTAIIASDGALHVGAADTRAIDALAAGDLERWWPRIGSAAWLFLDCNLPPTLIGACIARRREATWRLAIDGTSIAKVQRLPCDLFGTDLLFVNEDEARACGGCDALERRGASSVVCTRGDRGLTIGDLSVPAVSSNPIDVTGAGDALVAGTLYGLLAGKPLQTAVRLGSRLAALTVESPATVRPDLSAALLEPSLDSAPSALRSG